MRVRSKLTPFLPSAVLSPPSTSTFSPEASIAGIKGADMGSQHESGCGLWQPQSQSVFQNITHVIITSNGCPNPTKAAVILDLGWHIISQSSTFPNHSSRLFSMKSYHKQTEHSRDLVQAGVCQSSCAKEARVPGSFNLFFLPYFRNMQCMHTLHEQILGFLQTSCEPTGFLMS